MTATAIPPFSELVTQAILDAALEAATPWRGPFDIYAAYNLPGYSAEMYELATPALERDPVDASFTAPGPWAHMVQTAYHVPGSELAVASIEVASSQDWNSGADVTAIKQNGTEFSSVGAWGTGSSYLRDDGTMDLWAASGGTIPAVAFYRPGDVGALWLGEYAPQKLGVAVKNNQPTRGNPKPVAAEYQEIATINPDTGYGPSRPGLLLEEHSILGAGVPASGNYAVLTGHHLALDIWDAAASKELWADTNYVGLFDFSGSGSMAKLNLEGNLILNAPAASIPAVQLMQEGGGGSLNAAWLGRYLGDKVGVAKKAWGAGAPVAADYRELATLEANGYLPAAGFLAESGAGWVDTSIDGGGAYWYGADGNAVANLFAKGGAGAALRLTSPNGTLYELTPPDGGGAAMWAAV